MKYRLAKKIKEQVSTLCSNDYYWDIAYAKMESRYLKRFAKFNKKKKYKFRILHDESIRPLSFEYKRPSTYDCNYLRDILNIMKDDAHR